VGRLFRARLVAPAAYALVVGLMTFPALLHLSDRLIGNNVDNWIYYWNNWWLRQALAEGRDWFFTPYLFFPAGAALVAHANSLWNSLVALALTPALGSVAAFNLSVLIGLWLSAIGMYWLVRELTGSAPAALLAGFVFAFAPYHLTQTLAHLHLGSIQWWPFFALFLVRALRRRRLRDAAWAGAFAGLTLWAGFQLALLLGIWALLRIAWHALIESRAGDAGRFVWLLKACAVCAAAALAVSLPLALPLLGNWQEVARAAGSFDASATGQTDLLAYFLPPTYNPIAGSAVGENYERFVANRAYMPYLGYAALGLSLLAVLKHRREALFWALSGIVWIALAAGSVLRAGGELFPDVPMPYRLIGDVFPLSAIRVPDRFNLLLVFSLAVLTGLGAGWLWQRRRRLLALPALLIAVEYAYLPFPMWELPRTSPFYARLAQEPATDAVVDYPMDYTLTKLRLYDQTLHGKPMAQGHVSRYTLDDYAFLVEQPLLRSLYRAAEKPPEFSAALSEQVADAAASLPALGPALRSLAVSGVRYLLVHKDALDGNGAVTLDRALPLTPIYEDDLLAVYDFRRPLPYLYDGFPRPLGSTAMLARFDVQEDRPRQWRVRLVAYSQSPNPLPCQLELEGEGGAVLAQPFALFDDPALAPGDVWVADLPVTLPDRLGAGAYEWTASCAGQARYTSPDRLIAAPDGAIAILRRSPGLRYGDAIQLDGYRWWTVGAQLHVMLHWRALEAPRVDYKAFVHLLDPAGQIVRQYDAAPCEWACPTSGWQAGDVNAERAILSLAGLPAGTYRLAVGLYSAGTQTRLSARDLEAVYPDGYPILPDPFIITTGP
jgi:hypothetical protein